MDKYRESLHSLIVSEVDDSAKDAHFPAVTTEALTLFALRMAELEAQPWVVRVIVAGGRVVIADCGIRALRDESTHEGPYDCSITVSLRNLSELLSGEMDPRYALIYTDTEIDGSVSTAFRFFDWISRNEHATSLSKPSSSLPKPTSDRTLARTHLREFGYAMIEGVLKDQQLQALRSRTIEQASAERNAGCADFLGVGDGDRPPPTQRIWSLANKGHEYVELLDHPIIDEFIFESLGDECCLGGYWCLIAGPGNQGVFHTDQMGIYPPLPNVNVGVNLTFCLDDFTEANGATLILPGSHLPENRIAPDDLNERGDAVAIEAPAGSALLFDSRVWHATGANRTESNRYGLFLFFNRQWMRGIENPYLSTHPSIVEDMSDRVKTLYGLRHSNNLGRVGGSRMGDFVEYSPNDLVLALRP